MSPVKRSYCSGADRWEGQLDLGSRPSLSSECCCQHLTDVQ